MSKRGTELDLDDLATRLRSIAVLYKVSTPERMSLDLLVQAVLFVQATGRRDALLKYLELFDATPDDGAAELRFSTLEEAQVWLTHSRDVMPGSHVIIAGSRYIVGVEKSSSAPTMVSLTGQSNFRPQRVLETVEPVAMSYGEGSAENEVLGGGARCLLFVHAIWERDQFAEFVQRSEMKAEEPQSDFHKRINLM